MLAREHAGFDDLGAGPSYVAVRTFDAADGPMLPGTAIKVRYGATMYGGNTNDEGTTLIATDANPGTLVTVYADQPGYETYSTTVNTSADPKVFPEPFPMVKKSVTAPAAGPVVTMPRVPIYLPKAPAGAKTTAYGKAVAQAAPADNTMMYVIGGAAFLGVLGLIFIMIPSKKTAAPTA